MQFLTQNNKQVELRNDNIMIINILILGIINTLKYCIVKNI